VLTSAHSATVNSDLTTNLFIGADLGIVKPVCMKSASLNKAGESRILS
jgi:hypothetical protein